MLLLLACADPDPKPGDVCDTGDPTRATEACTEPVAPWDPPALACPLLNPRPVSFETLPPLWHLYGPDGIALRSFWVNFATYEDRWGCPSGSLNGSVEVWEGDCSGEGIAWAGRWTHTDEGDFESGPVLSLDEGQDVRFVETGWNDIGVAFDGYSQYTKDTDGVQMVDRDFRLELLGYFNPELGGEWEIRSLERWVPGTSYEMDGYFNAIPEEGTPGDYCLHAEAYPWPGCEEEPWGGWIVEGDATLVVTWDPDVACDGCGNATLNGVPVGQVCDTEFAYVPP